VRGLLKRGIGYYFNSETLLSRGIWISFFDTEEAQVVMPGYLSGGE
jgi:hypothetical protein